MELQILGNGTTNALVFLAFLARFVAPSTETT